MQIWFSQMGSGRFARFTGEQLVWVLWLLATEIAGAYFIRRKRPSFAWRPDRDIGIPVLREMNRFNLVMPSARFQEKVSPGPSFIFLSLHIVQIVVRYF